jgi:hypothetical protein
VPRNSRSLKRKKAKAAGFRSGLEQLVAGWLDEQGTEWEYESMRLPYVTNHFYKPDFILPNGVIIEVKGRFTGKDRSKHLTVKKQHPELDIRFLFQTDNTLSPASTTRYSDWCEKNGFLYAFMEVPEEWCK